jgi:hypothetical protein
MEVIEAANYSGLRWHLGTHFCLDQNLTPLAAKRSASWMRPFPELV